MFVTQNIPALTVVFTEKCMIKVDNLTVAAQLKKANKNNLVKLRELQYI